MVNLGNHGNLRSLKIIMKILSKTIFTGLMPNMTKTDIITACKFLFLPWKLQKGKSVEKVETSLKKNLKIPYVLTIDSGRSALFHALKALGVSEGDEVLVQAYTCLVVINPIRWTRATPVYVEVQDDFNMDPEDLKKKITNKTKVLIIQHTFGHPAKLDELLKIAKENNLKVIEDCAHSLGVKYKEKFTGTYGDAAIYSFGGEKVVSCVRGGAVVTNNEEVFKKLKEYHNRLPEMRGATIIKHLLKYPIFAISKPLYNFGVGKWILAFSNKLGLTSRIISNQEKLGKQDIIYPSKFPNALATILLDQLKSIDKIQNHRNNIAKKYEEELKENKKIKLPQKTKETKFLRYTILTKNKTNLIQKAKKKGIILGNWYSSVVTPQPQNRDITAYKQGSCPNAEKLAKMSVNLPIHQTINGKVIKKIIKIIKVL